KAVASRRTFSKWWPICNISGTESDVLEPGYAPGLFSYRSPVIVSRLLKLIREFSTRTGLPVEIDHIVDYLRSCGLKDEVYFWDVDMNTTVLRGTIVHWEYLREGWIYKVADIYTAKSLSLEEQRLVQAKELLHIL